MDIKRVKNNSTEIHYVREVLTETLTRVREMKPFNNKVTCSHIGLTRVERG
jgi:hypothetical protein